MENTITNMKAVQEDSNMNTYGYKEVRRLFCCDIKDLCKEKEWYTEGDDDEFFNLLISAGDCENITTDKLVELATDIKSHSSNDMAYGIIDIMHELAGVCNSYFEET